MFNKMSTYKPEYCELLIRHMAKGGSFTAFGAIADVSRETLYQWTREFPEFAEAKSNGEVKSLEHYEGLGYGGITGQIKNFNATAWIFTMKCRFKKYGYNQDESRKDDDDSGEGEATATNAATLLKIARG